MASVKADYYQKLITHAIKQRNKTAPEGESEKVELRIKAEWLEKLK